MCFQCLWILIDYTNHGFVFNAVLTITFLTDQSFTFLNCILTDHFYIYITFLIFSLYSFFILRYIYIYIIKML